MVVKVGGGVSPKRHANAGLAVDDTLFLRVVSTRPQGQGSFSRFSAFVVVDDTEG